ncbi:hypothetical protein HDU96_006793 [Phlyctochytrium bullatum]|nr:hypothetical protein HDU96_006793 [Phlyctochytrium bullatum]
MLTACRHELMLGEVNLEANVETKAEPAADCTKRREEARINILENAAKDLNRNIIAAIEFKHTPGSIMEHVLSMLTGRRQGIIRHHTTASSLADAILETLANGTLSLSALSAKLLAYAAAKRPFLFKLLRWAATATAVTPLLAIVYLWWFTRRSGIKGLPMVPPDPIVGNALQLYRTIDTRIERTFEVSQKLGLTWAYTLPTFDGRQNAMTVDPVVLEYIMKTNFNNYIKGPRFISLLHPLLGDGIFNSDGEQWRWQRKVSTLIFTGRNFRNVFVKVFAEDISHLVAFLDRCAISGNKLDIHGVLHAFTMDTFSKLAFGVDLHAMEDPTTPTPFAAAFDSCVRILVPRFYNPLWFITEHLDGSRAELRRSLKVVERMASEYIAAKRKARAEGRRGGEDDSRALKKDLLDLFMDADESGGTMTDKALRDMLLNMVLAGRDTTAQTLSWAILELMRNPDVVKNIRYEVETLLNNDIPTFDQVVQLKYLNAFLHEVLRLYPTVPISGKRSVKADVLPTGIRIPANTDITWSSWAMGRQTAVWGATAAEFDPLRWLDDAITLPDGTVDACGATLRRESQFKWMAFNSGPRVCIGQQMAMVEMAMTLCAVVPRFEFVPAEDMRVTHARAFSLQMGEGLSMYVRHMKA